MKLKDLIELINLRITSEKRLSVGHFSKDATNSPHINRERVYTDTKKDFWWAVPPAIGIGMKMCSKQIIDE